MQKKQSSSWLDGDGLIIQSMWWQGERKQTFGGQLYDFDCPWSCRWHRFMDEWPEVGYPPQWLAVEMIRLRYWTIGQVRRVTTMGFWSVIKIRRRLLSGVVKWNCIGKGFDIFGSCLGLECVSNLLMQLATKCNNLTWTVEDPLLKKINGFYLRARGRFFKFTWENRVLGQFI